ncbi:retrovirus-related pol polyprotein from transposon TNT 1-94 [Tanacetum coccineum]
MPMKQLSWKSPFEVLHGTPPSYETLKTIECLCYAAFLKPHKDKFDPRGPWYPLKVMNYLRPSLPESVVLPDPIPMPVSEENMEAPPVVDTVPPISEAPPVRRSNRNTSKPKWLKDFVGPKHTNWMNAMEKELNALERNRTWELGHKPITSKWVYKTKYKANETLNKYKARLVVRGYNQKERQDYKHTFSPVAKLATNRVIIALATAKN